MSKELPKSPGYDNVFVGETQKYDEIPQVREKFSGNKSNAISNVQRYRKQREEVRQEGRRVEQLGKDSIGTENVLTDKHERNKQVNPGFQDKTFLVDVEFDENGKVI